MSYYYVTENDSFSINNKNYDPTQNINNLQFDYIIELKGSLDDLFNTKQFDITENSLFVNFALNNQYYEFMFNNTKMSTDTESQITGISNNTDFNTRILEILALKIFGHAGARAAISNDTYITNNLCNNLYLHINKVIDSHKFDMYNQYNKEILPYFNYEQITNFDFTDYTLSFPGSIYGKLSYNFKPKTIGGISGVDNNGEYNIPILIKLGQTKIVKPYIMLILTYNNGEPVYIAFFVNGISYI